MKIIRFLIFLLLLISGISTETSAQTVPVIKFKQLQEIRNNPSDTLYVVNFWATWCKPCIKELPYFESANQKYKDQTIKIILISMDSKIDLETRVKPFIKKRNLQSKVMLLDEPDANSWIDKLEPQWSGAIPATIIFNNSKKVYHFAEKEFTEAELHQLIDELKAKK